MTTKVECKIVEEIDNESLLKLKRKLNMTYDELTQGLETNPEKNIPLLLEGGKIIVTDVKWIGKGSYANVYKAQYTHNKNTIYKKTINVAIKVIKIAPDKDKIVDLNKEVKLLNDAYNYRSYDGSYIVPRIYKCVFFCNNKNYCKGIQIIIMELGVPFNTMLKHKEVSTEYKATQINTILEYYETMIMEANIYIFDVKPGNAIISYKEPPAPKIIDLGYKHVFENLDNFFDRKKLESESKNDIIIDDNELKLLFLTIIQLQFLLISIEIIDETYSTTKGNELIFHLFKTNSTTSKIINRYLTNKKISTAMKLFLTNENYLPEITPFITRQQTKMINLFGKYLRLNGNLSERYSEFIKKLSTILTVVDNIPTTKQFSRSKNNSKADNSGYNNSGYDEGEEDEDNEDEEHIKIRYNKNEKLFLNPRITNNIKNTKPVNKVRTNIYGEPIYLSKRNTINNTNNTNNPKSRFGPSEKKQKRVRNRIMRATNRFKYTQRSKFRGRVINGKNQTTFNNRKSMMDHINTMKDKDSATEDFEIRQNKLLKGLMRQSNNKK